MEHNFSEFNKKAVKISPSSVPFPIDDSTGTKSQPPPERTPPVKPPPNEGGKNEADPVNEIHEKENG